MHVCIMLLHGVDIYIPAGFVKHNEHNRKSSLDGAARIPIYNKSGGSFYV